MDSLSTNDQIVLARSRLWTPELDKLLRKWKSQIGTRQVGHALQSRKFSRRHLFIGVPATLLAAIVSTGVLSTFRNCTDCDDLKSAKCEADQWIRLAMGLLAVLSTALAGLQTFLNYQEAAEQHKNAASDFENLHRVLETLLQVPGSVRGDPVSTLHNLRDQYTALVRGAPQLPKKYSVDLNYNFVRNPQGQGPKPPQPTQIYIGSQRLSGSAISPLKKILEEDSQKKSKKEKAKAKLKRGTTYFRRGRASSGTSVANTVSNASEDEEVAIGFDLDSVQSYTGNKAALAAAQLAAEREGQVQRSLSRALEFELQRLDTHGRETTSGSVSDVSEKPADDKSQDSGSKESSSKSDPSDLEEPEEEEIST